MRLLFATIVFGAALMSCTLARAELVNGTQFQSGAWKGAAYTSDSDGRFSHCAMSTDYQSGISMFFAISANYTWRLGWSSKSWNLNVGQTYGVVLNVDGVKHAQFTGCSHHLFANVGGIDNSGGGDSHVADPVDGAVCRVRLVACC